MDPAADLGLPGTRKCIAELPDGSFVEFNMSSEPSPKRRSSQGSTNTEVSPIRGANGVFLEF